MIQLKTRTSRGDTLFPGISRHSSALGCSRTHLFLVLKGDRKSAPLVRKYKALLKQEGLPIPTHLKAS